MPLRYCTTPGCPELTEAGGKCAQHRQQAARSRPSPRVTGRYDRTWERLPLAKLAANPFCEIRTHCFDRPIVFSIATQVDHIIPIRQRPDLRLAWSNLQSACESCHSAKTMRENREAGKGGGGENL